MVHNQEEISRAELLNLPAMIIGRWKKCVEQGAVTDYLHDEMGTYCGQNYHIILTI